MVTVLYWRVAWLATKRRTWPSEEVLEWRSLSSFSKELSSLRSGHVSFSLATPYSSY